jgi:hypothetical protein
MHGARRIPALVVLACLVAACGSTAPSGPPSAAAGPASSSAVPVASATSAVPVVESPAAAASVGPTSTGTTGFSGQTETVPADWTRFDDPDGLFHVAFPGAPTRGAGPTSGSVLSSTIDQWQSTDLSLTYAILASHSPAGQFASVDIPSYLRTLEQNMSSLGRASIAADQDGAIGTHPVRDSRMISAGGDLCARFLVVGDVTFAIVGTAPSGCPPHFAAFLGSFEPSDGPLPSPSS